MSATPPQIRYAKNGPVHLAYQTLGTGTHDVLYTPGAFVPISMVWDFPPLADFLGNLANLGRLIMMDRRGVGFSDPVTIGAAGSVEDLSADITAVLDAVGATDVTLMAEGFASPAAIHTAVHQPDRVSQLVLVSPIVRLLDADDFPLGTPEAEIHRLLDEALNGDPDQNGAPEPVDDSPLQTFLDRAGRIGASPTSARAIYTSFLHLDVRPLLPEVKAESLVLFRPDAPSIGPNQSEYVADRLPFAKLKPIGGTEVISFAGDTGDLLGEIEELVTGIRGSSNANGVLSVMVFTDIVNSTELASSVGDLEWTRLLDTHDSLADEALERHRGRKVNPTGDGLLATFETPSGAIGFVKSLISAMKPLGIDVRAGLHVAEVEKREADIGGLGVNYTARVAACAEAGELLVSSVVPILVQGGADEFESAGMHTLRGLPGEAELFRLIT